LNCRLVAPETGARTSVYLIKAILSFRNLEGDLRTLGVANGVFIGPDSVDGPELDVSRFWAMGGLADCHAHLCADSHDETEQPGELDAARQRAFTQLEHGVFLVVDKGWRDDTVITLMNDPPDRRPDLEAAGRVISGSHGYFPGFAVETDDAGLVAAVQAANKLGGWVKLVGDWPQKGRGPVINFGEESLAAAVSVAHTAGARVAVHTMAPDTPGIAVRAGVDSIEHGLYLTETDLEALGRRRGAWVPTVVNTEDVMASLVPGSSGVRILGTGLENVRRLLPQAADMGVHVLCGTDLGLAHGQVAVEAVRLTEYGLSPAAAVAAAGPNAHAYLGKSFLRAGSAADLLLFERNLLDDPCSLSHPVAGMRCGEVVFDRSGVFQT
jgi:imidazolonepropionase-like amidohydrolase